MRRQSIMERFWEKVNKNGPIKNEILGNCWEWKDHTTKKGKYGRLRFTNKKTKESWKVSAHRISYLLHKGDIPAHLFVCHHCDYPPCVHPKHLYLGTTSDNAKDMVKRKRHPAVKLSFKEVENIIKEYESGNFLQKEIAKKYGVAPNTVSTIYHRKSWNWKG